MNSLIDDHQSNTLTNFKSKLYGRSQEIEQLFTKYKDAFEGKNQLVFIKGNSGVGKTALVKHFENQLGWKEPVVFLKGKQDVTLNNDPYKSINQSFELLVDYWESTPLENQMYIKETLTKEVGTQLKFLTNVFPKLALFLNIDAKSNTSELIEFKDRFNETVLKFINLLSRFGRKVIIFLDDLQWADLATVKFLKLWITEGKPNNVFFIASYRDDEVDENSWLFSVGLINNNLYSGITTIHLPELNPAIIATMYADVISMEANRLKQFSEIIFQLTGGIPLLIKDSLQLVLEDEIIRYDAYKQTWDFDRDKLNASQTKNLKIDFTLRKIKSIHPKSLEVLGIAAAIGKQFDTRILEEISKQEKSEINFLLKECVNNQLVNHVRAEGDDFFSRYEFVHDKIQDTAYSFISDEQKKIIHFSIGKTYEDALGYAASDKNIFDIVHHYNRCIDFFKTVSQKKELILLNLKAGKKAKKMGFFNKSVQYYDLAIKHIEKDNEVWELALVFDVYLEAGKAAYLKSDFVTSVMYFESALKYAANNSERAKVHYNFLVMYNGVSDTDAAWNSGVKTLDLLQVKIPKRINKITILKMFIRINFKLRKIDLDRVLERDDMDDKEAEQVLLTLMELISSAWDRSPEVLAYIVLKGFEILLKNGNSPVAYFGLAGYGALLGIGFGKIEKGWKYIRLGGQLTEKYDSNIFHGRGNFAVHGTYSYLIKHVKYNVEPLKDAYNFTKEAGDYNIAAYSSILLLENLYLTEHQIPKIQEQAKSYSAFLKRTSNFDYLNAQKAIIIATELLSKKMTEEMQFELEEFKKAIKRVSFRHIRYEWRVYYMDSLLQLKKTDEAIAVQKDILEEGYNALSTIEYHAIVVHALVYLEKIRLNNDLKRAKKYIKKQLRYAKKMAQINPDNFTLIVSFLTGVKHETNGKLKEALVAYKEAAKNACKQNYLAYEEVFSECALKAYEKLSQEQTKDYHELKNHVHELCYNRGAFYKLDLIKK